MFIELEIKSKKTDEFDTHTINTDRIDDFYPQGEYTKMWLQDANDSIGVVVGQTYDEIRNLLANVSLLVNE